MCHLLGSEAVIDAQARALGPGASLSTDHFEVDGARFPRRRYAQSAGLEPIGGQRRQREHWASQLDALRTPDELAADVPGEREVFTYISPAMARVLRRIALVDGGSGEHRGFVLLFGPTGCGKTTIAKSYCFLANHPLTELSFSGDTTLTDFYRSVEVVRAQGGGQSTVTVPGPAVEAMLLGKKLLINEINMVPADILVVFSQAMDTGRLIVSGTERGNVEVEVHRDFGIIGTANPNYVGTLELGRAMERRFGRGLGFIEMTFIPPDEEAAAIVAEFDGQPLFAEHGITLDPGLARRLTDLAADLRSDEQIGTVLVNRLSTRALIHWAGLSAITGGPLADVAERALFTTLPREARDSAIDLVRRMLGDAAVAGSDRLAGLRMDWPEVRHGQAVGLDRVAPPHLRPYHRAERNGDVVVHQVRFQKRLDDGTRVLIGEPFYPQDRGRVGLGLRLRAYDPAGRQITDRWRVEEVEAELRDVHGVNVPWRLGRPPTRAEALPCLTASSIGYLRLAEAALLMGRPVFLAGPTGAGKSSLGRTLALLVRKRLVEFSLTGETAKGDLTASRRLIGGITRWTTQAFLEALSRGDAVLINDYNVAYPDVHSLINGLFDKGAGFTLPDGTTFHVHPDAWVIATGSLEGPGIKPLNEAVENRFGAIVAVEYPPVAEEVAILEHVAPGLAGQRTIENCVRLVDYCRQIATGRVDPGSIVGLSRASQEALRQAARGAALSTAELVAIARASGTPAEFAQRFRTGVLEGASEAARRVLEPVILQHGVE
jgi:MoxR-like ATPase